MLFDCERQSLRQQYLDSWKKHQDNQALSTLEQAILDVVLDHPEYHAAMSNPASSDKDFQTVAGESNPFMHLSSHLAIREQVSTNRPTGIQSVFTQLAQIKQSPHEAEHQMMEVMQDHLWLAMQNQSMFDETGYLDSLMQLLPRH